MNTGHDSSIIAPDVPDLELILPREYRLKDKGFQETFNGRNSIVSRFFVLYHLEKGGEVGKIGVIASKKTFHLSVERNRARRLLRESYRLTRGFLNPNVQIILIGRRNLLKAKSSAVQKDFVKIAKKAGIWRLDEND